MRLAVLSAACTLLSLGGHDHALADRAISPTDGLGDWAIESEFLCCGPGERKGTSALGKGLHLQLWPVDGLVIGAQVHHLSFGDEPPLEWGTTDLELNTGYLTRLNPSIIVRGDLLIALPTGQSIGTKDRVNIELESLLGFNFSARHDFFIRPSGGYSFGPGELRTYALGWSAGMAYQRPRFSLLVYGRNDFYRRNTNNSEFGSGGGFYFGWELGAGWTLGWRLDGRLVPDNEHGAWSELLGGFSVRWVFFPGNRSNRLRVEDHTRGSDWKTWNPSSQYPLPE